MNFKKGFLSLSLIATFALSSFAAATPNNAPEKKSTTVKVIHNTIQKLDLDIKKIDGEKVKLKFMVNDKDELIVLSTEGGDLDGKLKSALNYKAIKSNDLTPFKVYVLPIAFQNS